ncbi:hypothetical protein PPBDW_I21163 [Photobacterium kishitanii]|nr:hypothetical protein PPBDW_I21163 [Photobacterium kishitanii]
MTIINKKKKVVILEAKTICGLPALTYKVEVQGINAFIES